MLVFADGTRTFSVDDITEDNYTNLHNLELNEIPLILRARIADILWTNKKEFDVAKIAADTYWQLFKLWYMDEDVIGSLDMLRRAVCITTQIKYNELHIEIHQWFNDFIDTKVTSLDAFFSLGVMRLFFKQKWVDISVFPDILDDLIQCNIDDVAKVEQAYKLKTKCLSKTKRNDDVKK